MIQTIEGRLGGGKTYTAMGWICNHLRRGGVVATNINVQIPSFEDQYGKKMGLREVLLKYYSYTLKDEQIIRLSDVRTVDYATKKGVFQLNEITMFYKLVPRGTPNKPVLVVVDEAHIHFPQDGYRSIPKEVLHFLTLSRHACVDVVFISQHIKNMWCQMLRLAQFRWMIRDMKKYGFPVGPFNIPWPWPHFLQVKNDYDGITTIGRKFEWHRKYLYETYRSPELAAAFESMDQAAEVDVEKVGLSMKQKWMLFGSGLAAGIAMMIVPACRSHGGSAIEKESESRPGSGQGIIEKVAERIPDSEAPSMPGGFDRTEYFQTYYRDEAKQYIATNFDRYSIGDFFQGRRVVRIDERRMTFEDGSIYRLPGRPSNEPSN